MSRTAYTLREEYAGTVKVETDDGDEERPVFQGGVLAFENGSLDVSEALKAGDGLIVVDRAPHTALVALLDEYAALKQVPVPAGAKSLNPYTLLSREILLGIARRRRLKNPTRLNNANLARALARQDAIAAEPADDERVVPDDLEPGTDAVELAMAEAKADEQRQTEAKRAAAATAKAESAAKTKPQGS